VTNIQTLTLEQTDRLLAPFLPVRGAATPPGGWLRAVREALGRSLRAQARRLGISQVTLVRSEQAEAEGSISLAQLRKLAAGLDCEVVYAIVPREPLRLIVEKQAERLAREEVSGVAHSMGLEDQRPSEEFVDQQIAERKRALLSGPWSKLWR
jgi:predicted DNA-binding mobile mystery protein A